MEVFKPYALATSAYLTVQSIPLLFTPSLLITLCAPEPRRITDLETYLARALALSLLTLAGQTIVLTDVIPLGSNNNSTETNDGEAQSPKNPYAKPTIITTTIYHALSAFYLYTRLLVPGGGWNFAFTAGMVLSATLFCVGMWALLFGDEKGRLSKTGNDKRTGNFPFENKESAREKKKEERKEDKEGSSKGTKKRSVLRTGSSR